MEKSSIIFDLARSYLSDNPDGWNRFVNNLALQVAKAAKLELADRLVPIQVQDASELVYSIISESFMAPDCAQLILRCRNDNEVKLILSEMISDKLKSFEVYGEKGYWGEIIDVNRVATQSDVLDEISSDDYGYPLRKSPGSGYSIFKAFVVSYENHELNNIVSDTVNNISKLKDPKDTTLIRLNLIDSALYQALISNPNLLKSLNWRIFEKLLEDILKTFGYTVELQQGTKDGGIDLIAVKKDDMLGGHRYLLQAKRYKNKVGVEPIRQLLFLHSHYRATKSCLACTASFTKGAWKLAEQYRWQLELKDMSGLVDWLKMAANFKGLKPFRI